MMNEFQDSLLSFRFILPLVRVINHNNCINNPNHLHFVDFEVNSHFIDEIFTERMIAQNFNHFFEGFN